MSELAVVAPELDEPIRAAQPGQERSWWSVLGGAAGVLVLLAAFVVSYVYGWSNWQEQRTQRLAYAQLRGLLDPSSPEGPALGGVIRPGTPVALIDASTIGIRDLIVREGTTSSELMGGPGHLRDSPLPGQAGQSVIIGKGVSSGAPLRRLSSLKPGDRIEVTTGQGVFTYVVVPTAPTGPDVGRDQSVLTLVTASGSGSWSRYVPTHETYVYAALSGEPAPTPLGRLTRVPAQELPGHADPGAWWWLMLWAIAAVGVACTSVWLWWRWGRWQTWVLVVPVSLGVLWGLASATIALLPNTF